MDCFLLLILYLVWKKLRVSPVLLLAFAFAALYWTQLALSAFGAFYRQIVSALFVPAVYFFVGSGGYMGGLLLLFQKAE